MGKLYERTSVFIPTNLAFGEWPTVFGDEEGPFWTPIGGPCWTPIDTLFDKDPAITADGYLGSRYVPYGGYWYLTIGKRF